MIRKTLDFDGVWAVYNQIHCILWLFILVLSALFISFSLLYNLLLYWILLSHCFICFCLFLFCFHFVRCAQFHIDRIACVTICCSIVWKKWMIYQLLKWWEQFTSILFRFMKFYRLYCNNKKYVFFSIVG